MPNKAIVQTQSNRGLVFLPFVHPTILKFMPQDYEDAQKHGTEPVVLVVVACFFLCSGLSHFKNGCDRGLKFTRRFSLG